MRLTYLGGLPHGRSGQPVDVELADDDLHVRHAGLFSRWHCAVPSSSIRGVTSRDEGAGVEITIGGSSTPLTLAGPSAIELKLRIKRVLEYAAAVEALSSELHSGNERAPT